MQSTKNSLMLFEARHARHKPHIILQVLIFLGVFMAANMAMGLLLGIPLSISIFRNIDLEVFATGSFASVLDSVNQVMQNLPSWFYVITLFATSITTAFAVIYVRFIEGRSFASMGLRKKGFLKKYALGYLIGAAMIAATMALSVLLGGSEFNGINPNIPWGMLGLFFLGYLIQGMSEEVLVRGYFMVSAANRVSISVAVGLSSIIFALMHSANSGMSPLSYVNIFLFGVFAAVYILRTDDLWGACAIHAAWNFFQGNIFGIAVSGSKIGESVFETVAIGGRDLISGGSFGIEGGICTSIVMASGIALVLFLPQKPRAELPEYAEAPLQASSPMTVYSQN